MPSAAGLLNRSRLVLFDIDGTLLRNGNGVHGRAIVTACEELTGHDIASHFAEISPGGRTDRYIVGELLRLSGLEQVEADALFDAIADRSVQLTGAGLTEPNPTWVLPGSHALLSELMARGVAFGLVTGNLPKIAELKLRCAQIWEPFALQDPLITGFGDISEDRNDLSRAALDQARSHLASDIDGAHVVIVGDTPRDIECAHAIGASCLAVATGRFSHDELRAAGATHVVNSLEEAVSA